MFESNHSTVDGSFGPSHQATTAYVPGSLAVAHFKVHRGGWTPTPCQQGGDDARHTSQTQCRDAYQWLQRRGRVMQGGVKAGCGVQRGRQRQSFRNISRVIRAFQRVRAHEPQSGDNYMAAMNLSSSTASFVSDCCCCCPFWPEISSPSASLEKGFFPPVGFWMSVLTSRPHRSSKSELRKRKKKTNKARISGHCRDGSAIWKLVFYRGDESVDIRY